jgi:hypothetical protein
VWQRRYGWWLLFSDILVATGAVVRAESLRGLSLKAHQIEKGLPE